MPLRLVGSDGGSREPEYDAEAIAREFARMHRRRVKRYKTLGTLTGDSDTTASVVERFTVSVRNDGVTKRLTCNLADVDGVVDRALPIGMSCSIGAAMRNFTHESRFRAGGDDEFPVFITGRRSERVPELLREPALLATLDALALAPGEYLQTTACVGFLLVRPTLERILAAFDAVTRLALALGVERTRQLPARYPQSLNPISPLVLEWGILNSAARAAKIADAHPDALAR